MSAVIGRWARPIACATRRRRLAAALCSDPHELHAPCGRRQRRRDGRQGDLELQKGVLTGWFGHRLGDGLFKVAATAGCRGLRRRGRLHLMAGGVARGAVMVIREEDCGDRLLRAVLAVQLRNLDHDPRQGCSEGEENAHGGSSYTSRRTLASTASP